MNPPSLKCNEDIDQPYFKKPSTPKRDEGEFRGRKIHKVKAFQEPPNLEKEKTDA
jgi:hypothetical protein